MSLLLEVKDLVWRPDDEKILDVESLDINVGERIAIIGANGAGKSSLLKVLTYLEKNIEGEFKYPCFDTRNELEIRRKISAVFQNPNLLRGKVSDNITIGLKLRGCDKAIIKEKLEYWLKEFKIKHLVNRNARTLSKGESQRVSLARAMITDPEFLLLDEPFSNLDVPTRSEILTELSEIIQKSKTTLIMITHYPAEIPVIADRVVVMDEGRIIEDGTPYEVLEKPKHQITAKLVGIDNVYTAKVKNQKVLIDDIGWLCVDESYGNGFGEKNVFIKPDLIKLDKGYEFNVFNFEISKIVPMHDSINLISYKMPLIFRVSRRDFMKHKFFIGKIINIHIPLSAVIIGGE